MQSLCCDDSTSIIKMSETKKEDISDHCCCCLKLFGGIMTTIAFNRITKSRQRDRDIVSGYIKKVQKLLPTDNSFHVIVQLIQDLCLLYFSIVIDTKILTDSEQSKLIEMVNDHTTNKFMINEWRLLYRATRDGFEQENFYQKCDEKNNTICIIQTTNDNIFGGYTSLKLSKSQSQFFNHETDPFAFVYLIRSNKGDNPRIFPVQNNGKLAIQHYMHGYLSFGQNGRAFYFTKWGEHAPITGIATHTDCPQYNLHQSQLNGADHVFKPTEIEIFQFELHPQSQASPKLESHKLLTFGYIRQHSMGIVIPEPIILLICNVFYFQPVGSFMVIFEYFDGTERTFATGNTQDLSKSSPNSFIKTFDISNQWIYPSALPRSTYVDCKRMFVKSHESSCCIIPRLRQV